ncbi:MAG: TIGR04076 family protein [Planctomycetes bacterium]|nr:TIGR04076 family protein [Planctomycetota bacterium]
MRKVKITVVRTLSAKDLHGDIPANLSSKVGCSANLTPTCQVFVEGQEFIWPSGGNAAPEGFRCAGAWDDIHRHITVLPLGGKHYWMNEEGKYLTCCTDGFRPVIFRLDRLEEETK